MPVRPSICLFAAVVDFGPPKRSLKCLMACSKAAVIDGDFFCTWKDRKVLPAVRQPPEVRDVPGGAGASRSRIACD